MPACFWPLLSSRPARWSRSAAPRRLPSPTTARPRQRPRLLLGGKAGRFRRRERRLLDPDAAAPGTHPDLLRHDDRRRRLGARRPRPRELVARLQRQRHAGPGRGHGHRHRGIQATPARLASRRRAPRRRRLDSFSDGVRIRRALDEGGTSWQESRWSSAPAPAIAGAGRSAPAIRSPPPRRRHDGLERHTYDIAADSSYKRMWTYESSNTTTFAASTSARTARARPRAAATSTPRRPTATTEHPSPRCSSGRRRGPVT